MAAGAGAAGAGAGGGSRGAREAFERATLPLKKNRLYTFARCAPTLFPVDARDSDTPTPDGHTAARERVGVSRARDGGEAARRRFFV